MAEPPEPHDPLGPGRPAPAGRVPRPGGHGGDGARIAAALGLRPDEVLDLSASLNPVAPPAADVVARHLGALTRYPDPRAATEALADVLDVEPSRVLLTNGGAEAIALVGAELGGVVTEPDFSLYPRTGTGPRWRSNPHSPSGALHLLPAATPTGSTPAGAHDLDRTRSRLPDGSNGPHSSSSSAACSVSSLDPGSSSSSGTVWDEAFWPLATGTWTRRDFDRGDVVVGSLTKLFACPGLRVGYVVVPDGSWPIDGPALRRAVVAHQPQWSVGGLVCSALPDLLATADLGGWSEEVDHLRSRLCDLLMAHGLRTEAGAGPWVLAQAATGLRDRLALQGVVVRDCSSFGRPDAVRIAVPAADHLPRLDRALHAALAAEAPTPSTPIRP